MTPKIGKRYWGCVFLLALATTGCAEIKSKNPSEISPNETNTSTSHIEKFEFDQSKNKGYHLVATQQIQAELRTKEKDEKIVGRVSVNIFVPSQPSANDPPKAVDFNVVFFGVPQRLLNKSSGDKLGALGFRIDRSEAQHLSYNENTKEISGSFNLVADADFLTQFTGASQNSNYDTIETPVFHVTAKLKINLSEPINLKRAEAITNPAAIDISITSQGATIRDNPIPPFTISLPFKQKTSIDIGASLNYVVAQSLCIQPVFLMRTDVNLGLPPTVSIQLSGTALPYGITGLRSEWGKANVVFDFRDPIILFDNNNWDISIAHKGSFPTNEELVTPFTKAGGIFTKVNIDDCVEMFFVNSITQANSSPAEDPTGGGMDVGLGTINTKIVINDNVSRAGKNPNILAHEVGHALSFVHPNIVSEIWVTASKGTVMCPSGSKKMNPSINSSDNAYSLYNPLFMHKLHLKSGVPDCSSSSDCGLCPEI
jgi:hypothetical protein